MNSDEYPAVIPTMSPLPLLATVKPPLPKLVGPLGPGVRVYAGRSRPRANSPCNIARAVVQTLGSISGFIGKPDSENQSSQVNGSASGRDDIGPDLLQRYGVTGLGGPDG